MNKLHKEKPLSLLNVDEHVGKRLKLRRTMMGLSQKAVAKAVGITFQQVQKYEKGTNAMNATRLVEFARFMNVPVAYFFEGLEGYAAGAKHEAIPGFAEAESEMFEHKGRVSDRESLEMMKAFKRINEQAIRKRLSDLVRAVADNKPLLD
jgi:transcriptional regulator with XRE-family HTH domain